MDIKKESPVGARGEAGVDDVLLINAFAKGTLTAEQVYVFSLRLCDNEVDRDFERFDRAGLETLGALFLGKSGVFDHQWSAVGQTARIYRTELCAEKGTRTTAGDELCYLKGWAYLLRSEKNANLIDEIEAGIKKEVSVGCAVEGSFCSICGQAAGSCDHVKGRRYTGQLCFHHLRRPTDAYEWSFVAVPAQRSAGVMKHWGGGSAMGWEEGEVLHKQAALGRRYLESLCKEVCRLAMLAEESLNGELFAQMTGKLEEEELLELKRVYQGRAEERFLPRVQLKGLQQQKDKETELFLV